MAELQVVEAFTPRFLKIYSLVFVITFLYAGVTDNLLLATIALAVLIPVAYLAARTYSKPARKFTRNVVAVYDDKILLRRPLLVEYGYVVLFHENKRGHLTMINRFQPTGNASMETVLEYRDDGYVVLTGSTYAAILPAYRVLDECCRNVIVAAIGCRVSKCFSPASLTACDDDSCTSVQVHCSNGALKVSASSEKRGSLTLAASVSIDGQTAEARHVLVNGRLSRADSRICREETVYAVFTANAAPGMVITMIASKDDVEGVHPEAKYKLILRIGKVFSEKELSVN